MKIYNSSFFILFFIFVLSTNKIDAQFSKQVETPVNQIGASTSAPYISFDGKKMIYISEKDGKAKFFETTLTPNNTWSIPEPVDSINNFGPPTAIISSPCYNYDATVIYYSANYKNDSLGFDIYYSKKINGKWSSPQNIGAPINTNGYEGQPSITADDNTIYFVRENPKPENDDFKCYFIYYSERTPEGDWTTPKMLPVPINFDCEMSPRVSVDNKTLFMSSVREGGKGQFDLYYVKQMAKNVWTYPVSIDTMNSQFTDAYPTVSNQTQSLLYSITKKEKKKLISSVYKMNIPPQFRPDPVLQVKGMVTDLFSKAPVESKIVVTNPFTSRILAIFNSNATDGKYFFVLQKFGNYKIDVFSNNYSHSFFNLNTDSINNNSSFEKDISLYSKTSLRLNVFDKENFATLPAEIKVYDSQNNQLLEIPVRTTDKGRYNLNLPIGKIYKIEVKTQFYTPNYMIFDLSGVIQFDEFERDIELEPIKRIVDVIVTDDVSKRGLPVEIVITNINKKERYTTTVKADENGMYKLSLREGNKYEINVNPKGYSFHTTTIDVSLDTAIKKVDIKLTALKESAKLTFNDISFEFNSAELNASSFVELDKLVKIMQLNPDLKIEISAHTDDIGFDDYNMKLSERRAQSVVNYIIDKKIQSERMVAKGYGKTKPIVPNNSEENRARNRRVEMKVLGAEQK